MITRGDLVVFALHEVGDPIALVHVDRVHGLVTRTADDPIFGPASIIEYIGFCEQHHERVVDFKRTIVAFDPVCLSVETFSQRRNLFLICHFASVPSGGPIEDYDPADGRIAHLELKFGCGSPDCLR